MSLPTWLLKRRPSPRALDVVVIGAGVAGLACGAALARAGLQTAVIERARRPGGRLQSFGVQGWSVDTGPLLWSGPELRSVLAFAGVETAPLVTVDLRHQLRLALLTEKGAAGPWPLPVPGGVPSPAVLAAIKQLHDIPRRAFADLGTLCDALRTEPAPEGTTLTRWLEGRDVDGAVLRGLTRTAEILGAPRGRGLEIDAHELALRLASLHGDEGLDFVVAGDGPIPGARGVIQCLVDALLASGGELRLGMQARTVLVEDGAASGVLVSRSDEPFVETIEAGACVLAVGPRHLADLLPERTLQELPVPRTRITWACAAWGLDRDEQTREIVEPAPGKMPAPLLRALPVGDSAIDGLVVDAGSFAPRVAPPGHGLLLGRLRIGAGRPAELQQSGPGAAGLAALLDVACPGAAERLSWDRFWFESGAEVPLAGDPDEMPLAVPGLPRVLLASAHVAAAGGEPVARAASAGAAAARRLLGSG